MAAVQDVDRGSGPAGRTVVASHDGAPASAVGRNEVLLVGRVSAVPEERELPSGDLLASWRVVVDRPPPRRPAPEGVRLPTVDTVTCVAWTSRLRRTVAGLSPGDVVEVTGALRQRYWRAGAGLASRTEVEVASVRRLSRGPG
jgi:single-strand DNA-binding protein